jgi:hypothetical protein
MADYADIYGKRVKVFDSDPTLTSSYEGQVWYNSNTGVLKSVVSFDSFTSSTPYTTGRRSFGSSGTQTANLIYAGHTGSASNATEEYNGSGWTTGGNFGASGYGVRGTGTQTAALSAGLFTPGGVNASTYKYDGSTWTSAGSLPAARAVMGTAGTQTAGLAFGGSSGPFATTVNGTYEYDGSSWTAGNNLNTGRTYLAGFGIQTAAAGCGGYTGSPANSNQTGATEEYDGTNWSTSGSMNTARRAFATSGIQTAGLAMGGTTGSDSSAAEKYDGSTWTTSPATLGTATRNNGGSPAGTQSAAISTEGGSSPYGAKTEEFNSSTNVITAAAWSSGSNFPGPASSVRGFGTVHSASVAIGGETGPGPTVSSCYSYDGSSWTSVPAIPNTARNVFAYGTQTAGLYSGGNTQPGQTPISNASAEWDGSGWTGGPTVPTSRGFGASSGVQTSALSTAGDQGGSPFAATAVDSYNGSTWTSETAYPGGAYGMTGCGRSETTAFVFGGEAPYPGSNANVATYNGSAWTTTATPVNTILPANSQQASSYGEQDDCIGFGGTSSQSATAGWDGTAWSTRPNMGTGRSAGGTGISTDALAFCGSPVPNGGNKTEEFIGETSALNVKTLTQS